MRALVAAALALGLLLAVVTIAWAAPQVRIDSGPDETTSDDTPTFEFGVDAADTVECVIDGGTPVACSSPYTSDGLSDGPHFFEVRATLSGEETISNPPWSFIVDTVAMVRIDSGPSGPTSNRTPLFDFSAEPGATIECSIDQGSDEYGPCSQATSHSPASPLSDGRYTFRVRATDRLRNQREDSLAFSVDGSAPSLTIDSGPSGATNDATPIFGFTAEAGADLDCSLSRGSARYELCTSPYIVRDPLADGRYTFRVQARDALRNVAVLAQEFTVDTVAPAPSIGFGPSGTTTDTTPLFGFSVEAGARVECSIDQGTPTYGPCGSATTHAVAAPLVDGAYTFRVRETDDAGNQAILTRSFTVDTVPDPPAQPRADPTPTAPRLLSPFPLVRISGTLTSTGASISRLSVRAPRGALVRVAISPPCARHRRPSRRCHVVKAGRTVGRKGVVGFAGLTRTYRSGTVIVVRVWRADRIGKYTRFTIVRGKPPRRVDRCLLPGATRGSRCPST